MSRLGSSPVHRLLHELRTVSKDPRREYRRRLVRLVPAAVGYTIRLWITWHAGARFRPIWFGFLALAVVCMATHVNDARRARAADAADGASASEPAPHRPTDM